MNIPTGLRRKAGSWIFIDVVEKWWGHEFCHIKVQNAKKITLNRVGGSAFFLHGLSGSKLF